MILIWKQSLYFCGSTFVAQRKGNSLKSSCALRLLFFLFLSGQFALSFGDGDNDTELDFTCTNDFEKMFCQFKQQNCTDHNVTLVLMESILPFDKSGCTFQQCDKDQCCCSVKMQFVYGETHNATVLKGDTRVASKTISVVESFKPKTPTIVNVTETNGNFAVKWKTNLENVRDELTAVVTYYKKGDPEKQVSKSLKPSTVDGNQYYEISGGDLSPGATYVVSVRSVSEWSDLSSDSSAEWEFKTSTSLYTNRAFVIVILSIVAIFMSTGVYISFSKFKTKWWDKYSDLKLPTVLSSKIKILEPSDPIRNPVSVEHLTLDEGNQLSKQQFTGSEESDESCQDSSGISDCSSQPSYAETVERDFNTLRNNALEELFANIGTADPSVDPITMPNRDVSTISGSDRLCGVIGAHNSSGSSGVSNPTYFQGGSGSPDQFTPDQPLVLECEPLCHAPKCDAIINTGLSSLFPVQQDFISPISIDMSYQCTTGSQKISVIEDYRPLSPSNGTCTTPPFDPKSRDGDDAESESPELSSGTVMLASNEERPCNFLTVENNYQSFQRQTEEVLTPLFLSPPRSENISIPIITESGYKQV